MKKIVKKATKSRETAIKIGAGLAAAGAALATGFYFYKSANAKEHRKIAAKWAADMKKGVLEEAKKLKDVDSKKVAVIVDRIAKSYQAAREINPADVKRAAAELKANWVVVQREAKGTVRKSISRAKKMGKQAVTRAK